MMPNTVVPSLYNTLTWGAELEMTGGTRAQAAKIMGKDQQYIRQGIIQGILPIGTAFKKQGSKQYDYYISPKLFYEFTGYKIGSHTEI